MARKAATARKRTFHINAPQANSVLLAGDFTEWEKGAIPMQLGNDGAWMVTVKLAPGTHDYLFIVDGQWAIDPECTLRVPNPFGGYNMVCQIA